MLCIEGGERGRSGERVSQSPDASIERASRYVPAHCNIKLMLETVRLNIGKMSNSSPVVNYNAVAKYNQNRHFLASLPCKSFSPLRRNVFLTRFIQVRLTRAKRVIFRVPRLQFLLNSVANCFFLSFFFRRLKAHLAFASRHLISGVELESYWVVRARLN